MRSAIYRQCCLFAESYSGNLGSRQSLTISYMTASLHKTQMGNRMRKKVLWTALSIMAIGIAATAAWSQEKKMSASPHSIGSAKLIVSDLKKTQAFYEQMFGMKEVGHYNSPAYDEPIMGFESGARLAL